MCTLYCSVKESLIRNLTELHHYLINQISLVASQLKIIRDINNNLSFEAVEIKFEISEFGKWIHELLESGKWKA
jgi:conjugal transfer/entry exclusion protein